MGAANNAEATIPLDLDDDGSCWPRSLGRRRTASHNMGASQSTTSKLPAKALHVLRVTPSSPASQTTIEPYFDFVVGFKDESLSSSDLDASELERIVEAHEGRALDLLVWNSKSQSVRGTSHAYIRRV